MLREVSEEVGIKVDMVADLGGKIRYQFEGKEAELQPFLLFESGYLKEEPLLIRLVPWLRHQVDKRW